MKSPQKIFFKNAGEIPNNPHLPVLIYRQVLNKYASGKALNFRNIFEDNNWSGIWRAGIFSYTHFHSNAHEVLGIARGKVTVQLGGEKGKRFNLSAGDMVVLPAGTGHRKLSASSDLSVIGAYPKGQGHYDICRSLAECPNALKRIAAVKLPAADPFYGERGPLIRAWL